MSGAPSVLLAFDFGTRRIGIASANLLTRTASPLGTVVCRPDVPWREIDALINEWQPGRLVVGMPERHENSAARERIRAFADALGARYDLPVATVDEESTSRAAEAELKQGRRSGYLRRRITKGDVDSRAACLIAEQWISENNAG